MSNSKLIFSIIIPVYNKSELIIKSTLWSICAQLFSKEKYEVIFINDGDEEKKYDNIINFFKKKGMNIRFFYNINEGLKSPVHAWNIGIKKSKAPFIILNGADIMHLGGSLIFFEKLFFGDKEKEHIIYPKEFVNYSRAYVCPDGIVKNSFNKEFVLYAAHIWRFNSVRDYLQTLKNMGLNEETELHGILLTELRKCSKKDDGIETLIPLVGDIAPHAYPFLVAAKAGLFYEMGGFNENLYRIGWDDFEWWVRSLSIAITAMVPGVNGFHQWHEFNTDLSEGQDLNKKAMIEWVKTYFDHGLLRPSVNLGREWGEMNKFFKIDDFKKVVNFEPYFVDK